jgi:hypothetical protein
MGFFDKIKGLKNMVTGGGAKVTLQVGQVQVGTPIPVMVRAQIESGAISATKVYVALRGLETVDLIHRDHDGGQGDRDRVHETMVTFSQEFPITGPVELPAGSQHEWQGQIVIPADAPPTYNGKNAKHEWAIMAALDVTGNDPDSGWITIQVR